MVQVRELVRMIVVCECLCQAFPAVCSDQAAAAQPTNTANNSACSFLLLQAKAARYQQLLEQLLLHVRRCLSSSGGGDSTRGKSTACAFPALLQGNPDFEKKVPV
jgi:hypothetical protein